VSGSLKIGNVFGIPVRIHATFLLLVYALVLFAPRGAALSDGSLGPLGVLGLVAVTFGCVLLHELGHSLVARSYGLRVADITLWPLGGMARMSEIPENSRIEGRIAIAGPAVNFALAGLALLVLSLGAAFGVRPDSGVERGLSFFLLVNLTQGAFNLLPAFPMDGGRLLRAWLGRKRDWLAATESAVRVGRTIALVLFVGSLPLLVQERSFCIGPLVALFIWFEGTRELWGVRMRHGVSPFGNSVFGNSVFGNSVFGNTVFGNSARFGPNAPRPAEAEARAPEARPVEPVEPGEARRPGAWLQRLSRRGGFSEDEIRRLESHQGPLRRPPDEP
jgi:Zn-dependent protease